jgi:hypothetical protein
MRLDLKRLAKNNYYFTSKAPIKNAAFAAFYGTFDV